MSVDSVGALTDLSLEECLSELTAVEGFISARMGEIAKARKAEEELRTMIALLLESEGARRFDNGRTRVWFEKKKSGSASVDNAGALRSMLISIGGIPQSAIDEALPLVQPEPFVKPALRPLRKLAEYGAKAAAAIRAHIVEPVEREVLTIEEIPLNVTGSSLEALL